MQLFRNNWAVLLPFILFLLPQTATSDNGFEARFTGPVVAGEIATLAITLQPGCCPGPPMCEESTRVWTEGTVYFGDDLRNGHVWFRAGDGKPRSNGQYGAQEFQAPALYVHPGRYRVTLKYIHMISGCGTTQYFDSLTVDVLPSPGALDNGWIGTYFDPEATQCGSSTFPAVPIYVVANLAGASSGGIAGAVFRLRSWLNFGRQEGFILATTMMPGWIHLGDVFGAGITMAAITPMLPGALSVPLLKIMAFPPTPSAYTNLFAEAHLSPSNPSYTTPMLILNDAPTFTAIPTVNGYSAMLSSRGSDTTCPVSAPTAVQATTWSKTKALYRE